MFILQMTRSSGPTLWIWRTFSLGRARSYSGPAGRNGWPATESAAAKLEKLLQEKYEVVVEYTEPGDEEDVPILLHNNKFAEPVEGVIESYSVPSKGEIDPSMIVALFYYVQFGLMLSDAYAL